MLATLAGLFIVTRSDEPAALAGEMSEGGARRARTSLPSR